VLVILQIVVASLVLLKVYHNSNIFLLRLSLQDILILVLILILT